MGFLIRYKKINELIAGYNTTSEEQKEMDKKEISKFYGNWFFILAGIIAAGVLLMFFGIPFAEVVMWFLAVISILYIIWRSADFAPESKRRLNRRIGLGVILFNIFVGNVIYGAYSSSDLIVNDNGFEITGIYGISLEFTDIKEVYLDDQLPAIEKRVNGASLFDRSKGDYVLENLGKARIYVMHDYPPHLFIVSHDENYIIINTGDSEITAKWYNLLSNKL